MVSMKTMLALLVFALFLVTGCLHGEFKAENETRPSAIRENETTVPENETPAMPAHCYDGLYNHGEEGLDCGWSCPNECFFTEKCGPVEEQDTWSGNIFVTCSVGVAPGAVLRIEPGTVVKFRQDRDYKTDEGVILTVDNGTLIAQGNRDDMIWFTSAAPGPINGDWEGIRIHESHNSIIDHAVVEYGFLGVGQFNSGANVTNSIIRWTNTEGLYAERSGPVFINNTLYSNAYHEIALEQYNTNVRIINNTFLNGTTAIHSEETNFVAEGNYFGNYGPEPAIEPGAESVAVIRKNRFQNCSGPNIVEVDFTSTATIEGNDFGNGSLQKPVYDYGIHTNFVLDYKPGSLKDRFPYVYPEEDGTRRVVKRIGQGLGFGWSLLHYNESLWMFSHAIESGGKGQALVRINPETGDYEVIPNDIMLNPRGFAHDGEHFWANDFSFIRLYKFKIAGGEVELVGEYDVPEKEKGGTAGLASDGEYLYLCRGEKAYVLDKQANLVDEIIFPFCGNLVWAEGYFWGVHGCEKGLCKFDREGNLAGEIYPVAMGTEALAWDGKHLWAMQKTCETWQDPKIFEIEILNDTLGEQPVR
ncbi:hypothetical protein GF318_05785 [Candidatus Micrarchaeota archaeon]|nr:hypothetical protein [Candidatus Micrarchaeota archaeon]